MAEELSAKIVRCSKCTGECDSVYAEQARAELVPMGIKTFDLERSRSAMRGRLISVLECELDPINMGLRVDLLKELREE